MSLPESVSYEIPRPFPRSRAQWNLEPRRAAVLVHDMQQYFLHPFAPTCPARIEALANIGALLQTARASGIPVFYTAQTGAAGTIVRGLQGDLWGRGMQPIEEHTAIVDGLKPHADDVVLVKHRYSAFAHSDLAPRLAAAGRDQLLSVGVYAHIGVVATAYDAFQREIHPFVVGDAVIDMSFETHQQALALVASCTGVVTTTSDAQVRLAPAEHTGAGFDAAVREALAALLPAESVLHAFDDPDVDLFALGLDSVRAFELLDAVAEAGAEVDFGAFTRNPTIAFLRTSALAPR